MLAAEAACGYSRMRRSAVAPTMHAMTGSSYAMSWRENAGRRVVGKVELRQGAVVLEATVPPSPPRNVLFEDIVSTTFAGRVLRIDCDARVLVIESLDAGGALRELAERIDAAAALAHA